MSRKNSLRIINSLKIINKNPVNTGTHKTPETTTEESAEWSGKIDSALTLVVDSTFRICKTFFLLSFFLLIKNDTFKNLIENRSDITKPYTFLVAGSLGATCYLIVSNITPIEVRGVRILDFGMFETLEALRMFIKINLTAWSVLSSTIFQVILMATFVRVSSKALKFDALRRKVFFSSLVYASSYVYISLSLAYIIPGLFEVYDIEGIPSPSSIFDSIKNLRFGENFRFFSTETGMIWVRGNIKLIEITIFSNGFLFLLKTFWIYGMPASDKYLKLLLILPFSTLFFILSIVILINSSRVAIQINYLVFGL